MTYDERIAQIQADLAALNAKETLTAREIERKHVLEICLADLEERKAEQG